MAHLLGNKFCIDALRTDVADIQSAISDVFSRAGPVSCPSWKYPDKIASDMDIHELLELYEYSEEEEERQVAHIVLLELVIDRFVLLIQSMARYLEQTISLGKVEAMPSPVNNTSIGLVVKKYWNKMVHTHTAMQQLHSENKSKARKISDMENSITKLSEQLNGVALIDTSDESLKNADSSPGTNRTWSSGRQSKALDIARDEYNKSTQTVETAFVPCEACDWTQNSLKEIGKNMIDICQNQGLPSSLAKYRSQIEEMDWFCATDVARWTSEQSKDLARINKHMDYLTSLKSDLIHTQEKCKKLQGKLADRDQEVKMERESQNTQRKQFDVKLKEAEKRNSESMNKMQRQQDELEKLRSDLDMQVSNLQSDLKTQKQKVEDLEQARTKLLSELEENNTNRSEVEAMQKEVMTLKESLSEVTSKLEEATKDMNREKSKNRSAGKHLETIQSKQEGLLQRVDELDQENEELRGQVDDLEENKEKLEESLERAQGQRTKAESNLKKHQLIMKKLNEDKDNLEQSIEELRESIKVLQTKVEQAKEYERLLVEYPDLNGPVNPDLSGTGDIAVDMDNQVKANSIRIRVLEDENDRLRKTITKMVSSQGKTQVPDTQPPMQLWKSDLQRAPQTIAGGWTEEEARPPSQSKETWSQEVSIGKQNSLTEDKTSVSDQKIKDKTFIVSRGHVGVSKGKTKSRPSSAKSATANPPGSASSFAAYSKLKSAGMLKGSEVKGTGRPPSGRPPSGQPRAPSGGSREKPGDMYTCDKCDKMYSSKRDLDIHKSYCFGV